MLKYKGTQTRLLLISGFSREDIFDAIINVLNKKKTDNIAIEPDRVRFHNSMWSGKLRSNIAYMTYVKEGMIQVNSHEGEFDLVYTYYIPMLVDILLTAGFLLVGLLYQYLFLVLFAIIVVQLLYKIEDARLGSQRILDQVEKELMQRPPANTPAHNNVHKQ